MAEAGSYLASLVARPSFVAGHPSLAALLQARDALASYPLPGVNVHTQPDLSQAWLQEQTIEPVPFGSFADPVSQLAFLMAPGVLRGLKGTLDAAATPGPGLRGLLAGERGNLGPPPMSQPMSEDAFRYAWRQSAQTEQGIPLAQMGKEDAANWLGYRGEPMVQIYRGMDRSRPLQAGDFVTTSEEAARQYGGMVAREEVPASSLRYVRGAVTGDPSRLDIGGAPELIYAPQPGTLHKQYRSFEYPRYSAEFQGEPLPGSVVRDAEGRLQRLYHGTPSKYADFSMEHMDPQGLYGPGVYMTESADIAGGSPAEVARGYMGYASKGYQPDTPQWVAQLRDGWRDQLQQRQAALAKLEQEAKLPGRPAARDAERLRRMRYDVEEAQLQLEGAERDLVQSLSEGPHIRPVYADLKRPFDMGGRELSMEDTIALSEAASRIQPDVNIYHVNPELAYKEMVLKLGSKEAANRALQEAGYDGITHMGGAVTGGPSHRVYISFSPDTVYPSFNVDALR